MRKNKFHIEFLLLSCWLNHHKYGHRMPHKSTQWEMCSMLSSLCESPFTGFSRDWGYHLHTIAAANGELDLHPKQVTYRHLE